MGTRRLRCAVAGLALAITLANACGNTREEFAPHQEVGDAATDPIAETSVPFPDASPDAGPCRRDAGGKPATAWLFDECLWEPVPELEVCDVYQARLPDEGYPVQAWSDCGTGCRVIEPNILVPYLKNSYGYFVAERGWSDGTTLYASIQIGGPDVPYLNQIVDIEEFNVVAAFQTRHTTGPGGYADCDNFDVIDGFGPQLMLMFDHNVGSGENSDEHSYFARSRYRETTKLEPIVGFYSPGPGAILSRVGGLAFSDTHWSYEMAGSLYFTDQWTTLPPHEIGASALGSTPARRSFGEHFYWLGVEGSELHYTKVREWSPTGGAKDLLQRPDDVWLVDAEWGTSGLVWLEGKSSGSGLVGELAIFRIADPAFPTAAEPKQIAALAGEYSPGIVVGGDYFATVTCSEATFDNTMTPDKCPLVVVRLSDGKSWVMGPPAVDRWWAEPRFVDNQRLLIGDIDHPHYWGHGSQKLYLLDMNALDELQQQFPPP